MVVDVGLSLCLIMVINTGLLYSSILDLPKLRVGLFLKSFNLTKPICETTIIAAISHWYNIQWILGVAGWPKAYQLGSCEEI